MNGLKKDLNFHSSRLEFIIEKSLEKLHKQCQDGPYVVFEGIVGKIQVAISYNKRDIFEFHLFGGTYKVSQNKDSNYKVNVIYLPPGFPSSQDYLDHAINSLSDALGYAGS